MSNQRTYAICADLPADHPVWAEVMQRPDTARRSLDGSLVVLKWLSTSPTPQHLPDTATVLTHAEALAVMATPEWSAPIDLPSEP